MNAGRVEHVSMRVPSDLRYGEATRAMLDTLTLRLEKETETPNLRDHVISAYGEAFNNVVEHAYEGRHDGVVEVDVEVGPGGITVRLSDRGAGFDLGGVEAPDLEALPEGGLGLVIIRSLMTRVSYERGERNVLTMHKAFASPLSFARDWRHEA